MGDQIPITSYSRVDLEREDTFFNTMESNYPVMQLLNPE
jgi:hypothetical protein